MIFLIILLFSITTKVFGGGKYSMNCTMCRCELTLELYHISLVTSNVEIEIDKSHISTQISSTSIKEVSFTNLFTD